MADTIRIKRRVTGAVGPPTALTNAELAYNEMDHTLYYGEGQGTLNAATAIVAIGGQGIASNTTPNMDGTAAIGTAQRWARADHVHPTDTSRLGTGGGIVTGALTVQGGLTATTTASNLQSAVNIGTATQSYLVTINGAAGQSREIDFQSAGILRWSIAGANATGEGTNNVGSDFIIQNYSDAGSALAATPLTITRASGAVTIGTNLSVTGTLTAPTISGTNVTLTGTLTAPTIGATTFSSTVTLHADPTTALQAVTKQYADAKLSDAPNVANTAYGRVALAWSQVPNHTIVGNVNFDLNTIPAGYIGTYQITTQTTPANFPPGQNTGFVLAGYSANTGWQDQLFLGSRLYNNMPGIWFRSNENAGLGATPWHQILTDAGGTITGNVTLNGTLVANGGVSGAGFTNLVAPYAPLASPAFTGTPSLPTGTTGVTQTAGTNNTTLATTAFVAAAAAAAGVTSFNTRTGAVTLATADVTGVNGALTTGATFTGALVANGAVSGTGITNLLAPYALLASPTFTGTPIAPTAAPGTNSTQIATTAFVTAAASAAGVTSWNTRTGAVTLTAADVTGVNGALTTGATFTGAVTMAAGNALSFTNTSNQIKNTGLDGASFSAVDFSIGSWWGFGFTPTVAATSVPVGLNSIFLSTRTGDFSALGNIKSFSVNGADQHGLFKIYRAATDMIVELSANAVYPSAATIAAGGSGVAVNDRFYDAYNNAYTATAVTAGAATTITTQVASAYLGAPPANPVALTAAPGFTGTGVTVNLTWTAANRMVLQHTAGGILLNTTTGTQISGGMNFGSTAVTGVNLASHIALYSNSYGINVISGTLQLVAAGVAALQLTSGGVTVPGTLAVTGATTITGSISSSGGFTTTGRTVLSATAPTQGAYLIWNRLGDGSTSIINQKGLGAGGFRYGEVDTSGNYTECFSVGPTGNTIITGTSTHTGAAAFNNNVTVNPSGATWPSLTLQKTSGTNGASCQVSGQTGANVRWTISLGDQTNEGGSNTGSNFAINRFNDAGTFIDAPLSINRANGAVSTSGQINASGSVNGSAGFFLPNNIALSANDSGGTQRNMLWISSGNVYALGSPSPGYMWFYPASGFVPAADSSTWCGITTARWAAVAAANGTIQTSDVALKTDVARAPNCLDLVEQINPITYRWKDDTGCEALDRTHWGFDADNVRDVMHSTGLDFGGYIGPEHEQPISPHPDTGELPDAPPPKSLNYSQLVAVLWKAVQELRAENRALQQRIK